MNFTKLLTATALTGILVIPIAIEIFNPEPAIANVNNKNRRRRRRRHARTGSDASTFLGQFNLKNFTPEEDFTSQELFGDFIEDEFQDDQGVGLFHGAIQDFSVIRHPSFNSLRFLDANIDEKEILGDPDKVVRDVLFGSGNLLAERVEFDTVRYTIFSCYRGGFDCLMDNDVSRLDNGDIFFENNNNEVDILTTMGGVFSPGFRLQNTDLNISSAINDLDFIIDEDLLNGLETQIPDEFSSRFELRSFGNLEIEDSSRANIPEPHNYLGALMAVSFIVGFRRYLNKQRQK